MTLDEAEALKPGDRVWIRIPQSLSLSGEAEVFEWEVVAPTFLQVLHRPVGLVQWLRSVSSPREKTWLMRSRLQRFYLSDPRKAGGHDNS